MIKVNLIGAVKNKAARAGIKIVVPPGIMPFVLLLIVLGFGGGGYWWYSTLSGQAADLSSKIVQAEAQKAALEKVIQQDQVYEALKKALENRVKIIESLQRNQVSPVVALDALSEAVDKTKYVWLSSLDQNNAVFNMAGQGTSYLAVADFYSNLKATGYFITLEVPQVQESGTGFTFSLRCEFAPPHKAEASPTPGGN